MAFDVANQRVYVIDDVNNNLAADPGERVTSATFQDGVIFGAPPDTWIRCARTHRTAQCLCFDDSSGQWGVAPRRCVPVGWGSKYRRSDLPHVIARGQHRFPWREHPADHGPN